LSNGSFYGTAGYGGLNGDGTIFRFSIAEVLPPPNLAVTHAGNSVIVSWPNTGAYTLQQNSNVAASAGWTTSGYTVSAGNGTNSITIPAPAGSLFFRLANP
jgi:uncharacterized repeat protein (TIGR03803 family)